MLWELWVPELNKSTMSLYKQLVELFWPDDDLHLRRNLEKFPDPPLILPLELVPIVCSDTIFNNTNYIFMHVVEDSSLHMHVQSFLCECKVYVCFSHKHFPGTLSSDWVIMHGQ